MNDDSNTDDMDTSTEPSVEVIAQRVDPSENQSEQILVASVDRNLSEFLQAFRELSTAHNDFSRQIERRAQRHDDFSRRLNSFHRYFYTNASVKNIIFAFALNTITAATNSATGARILNNKNSNHQINEAVKAILLGVTILNPVQFYSERVYAFVENPSTRFKYLMYLVRLMNYFTTAIIGYELLKSTAGVEMTLEQHIAAYGVGTITLYLPMICAHAAIIFRCYKDYFHTDNFDETSSDDIDEISSQHSSLSNTSENQVITLASISINSEMRVEPVISANLDPNIPQSTDIESGTQVQECKPYPTDTNLHAQSLI